MGTYLTPSRVPDISLDYAETMQNEPYFALRRDRFEIRPGEVSDVEQLASGCWILKPETTSLFYLHENTAGQVKALRLNIFEAPPQMIEAPVQRKYTELTGIGADASVSTSGDHFLIKRLAAADNWNIQIIASTPQPTQLTTPNYPMDRVLEMKNDGSTGIHVDDQGYLLRWIHPGHPQEYIDYVWTFYFGGPLYVNGYGEFALTFGGDGRAYLYERYDGAWNRVDEWRYAPSEVVPGMPHTVRVIPYAGRYMEIRTNVTEKAEPGLFLDTRRLNAFAGRSIHPHAHTYEVKNRETLALFPGGLSRPVTGPGRPKADIRRDLLLRLQISRITYPASGYLTDVPFTIPFVNGSSHALEVKRYSIVKKNGDGSDRGATSAQPINALTGTNLGTQNENYTFFGAAHTINGWQVPAAPAAVKLKVTLTNNDGAGGPYSPVLFGYEARKLGSTASTGRTAVTITSSHHRQSPVQHVSITGQDKDPSHATAALEIADLTNRVSLLANRGALPVKVQTTYDPADQAKKSILFEGYAIKPTAKRRGFAGKTYPSPNWRDYYLQCLGKWKRLHEREWLTTAIWSFAEDRDAAAPIENGHRVPWKITDAIKFMLVAAGFPESQIDVPDYDMRFWYNGAKDALDTITIRVGTNIGEWIVRVAEEYLNHFLTWDPNAGSAGQWRLRPVPLSTDTALWTFVLAAPGAGKLATVMGSYGADTATVQKDTLEEWVLPPEGNFLRVTGVLSSGKHYTCQARNPKSYNRPGDVAADPNDPDYLGYLLPILRKPDPLLTTKEAVHFATRRIFDLACRAEIGCRFTAPLVLIDAAAAEPSVYTTFLKRPLMFGDVVTFNGAKWMVRGCSIDFSKGVHMLADYECVRFRDPLPQ